MDKSVNPITNNFESFKFESRFLDHTDNDGTINVKAVVPLKYLSNICRTIEMFLINYKINVILTWSSHLSFLKGIEQQLVQ